MGGSCGSGGISSGDSGGGSGDNGSGSCGSGSCGSGSGSGSCGSDGLIVVGSSLGLLLLPVLRVLPELLRIPAHKKTQNAMER